MKRLLFIFSTLVHCVSGFSQGLNNKYSIDSTDIENAFELLGMEIYKFPIQTKDSAYVNVIIEKYDNHTLVESYDHMKNLKDIPKEYLESLSVISTPDTSWFRVYFYKKNDSTLIYRFNHESVFVDIGIDDIKDMDTGTRAYDFKNIEENKGQTVLIWYGSERSDEWRHCPAGLSLKQVVKKYDKVIAFKLELKDMD